MPSPARALPPFALRLRLLLRFLALLTLPVAAIVFATSCGA